MTEFETKRIASAAAREALHDFMLMLGVDISTPAGVIDLQKDFHHVRNVRLTGTAIRDRVVMALTGSAVTGLIGSVGFYLLHHSG